MKRSIAHRRAGFTLLELAISSVVFAIVLVATLSATMSAQREFGAANALDRLEARSKRAVELVREPFVAAGLSELTPTAAPPLGSDHMTFRTPTGLLNGAVTWDVPSNIRFAHTLDEPDNGLDDDGDGLVDEGQIVMTRFVGTANEQTVVLAADVPELMTGELPNGIDDNGNGLVDEKGLAFSLDGMVLTIYVAVGGHTSAGLAVTNLQQTSITIRN